MENGLMVPLAVAIAILGLFATVSVGLLLNLGVFIWAAIAVYLSPIYAKLNKENKIRWKRYIESFDPATHDWEKSLKEYIAQNLRK
jgi:hypothetical protein